MTNIKFQKCDLLQRTDFGEFDLIVSDPPFGIVKPEGMYHRRKEKIVGGYEEPSDLSVLYHQIFTAMDQCLKDSGLAFFLVGPTALETAFNALRRAFTKLEILNHTVHPYSFGVYAPTKFVTSHYNGLLLRKKTGKVLRHYKSANKGKPYTQDVIPIEREYLPGQDRYQNQLPVLFCRRMVWHLCPEDGSILDLCCGSGSFAVGAREALKSFSYLGIDNNAEALKLARKRVR